MKFSFGTKWKMVLINMKESTASPWFCKKPAKICTELPVSDKMRFSKFCDLCPKNVLLLKQSPVNQCKYILQKIFLLS